MKLGLRLRQPPQLLHSEAFRNLAVSITENSKGMALLQALKVAFDRLRGLGAADTAIIVTESRRTQE